MSLKMIQDYKHIKAYRDSFMSLSQSIFGIDFNRWYHLGFWDHRYVPVSFVDGDQVVSNVSINYLDLIISGKRYPSIQLGTVMTHPDYRNQGLSSCLLRQVIQKYKSDYVIYLFANRDVLNYYPKFGFQAVDEYLYSVDVYQDKMVSPHVRRLNIDDDRDFYVISSFVKNRLPVGSGYFSTDQADSILMFYCLNVFYNDLYFLEDQDIIVIFKRSNERIEVFDIISQREFDMEYVLKAIAIQGMNRFVFHFTPNCEGIEFNKHLYRGSEVLFVQFKENKLFPFDVKHPITSQA